MERPNDLSRWGLNNWGDDSPINEQTVLHVAEVATNYFKKSDERQVNNSSYRLKHLIERHLESYISNGELIAGMVEAGFDIYRISKSRPNCYFNLDPMSVVKFEEDFGLQ